MQIVINKAGVTKLAQYGQWDGDPEGQGINILTFLRDKDTDLIKYNEEVSKLVDIKSLYDYKEGRNPYYEKYSKWLEEIENKRIPTEEKEKIIRSNDQYFSLSRDCGSRIHKMIYEGRINVVKLDEEGKNWAAGFYLIDLQKGVFHASYSGKEATFKLNNLPSNKKFIELLKEDDTGYSNY